MARMLSIGMFVGGCLLANVAQALAISIQYQLFDLGGNEYAYEYTVSNNDTVGGGALTLFDILFDPDLYLYDPNSPDTLPSLQPDSPPEIQAGWTEIILAPATGSTPTVPTAYDVSANTGGLPAGTSLGGFTVKFTWLGGPALPGPQPFEVYDPDTFELLATGVTAPLATVAEPPVWGLLAFGGLALLRRRYRRPLAL